MQLLSRSAVARELGYAKGNPLGWIPAEAWVKVGRMHFLPAEKLHEVRMVDVIHRREVEARRIAQGRKIAALARTPAVREKLVAAGKARLGMRYQKRHVSVDRFEKLERKFQKLVELLLDKEAAAAVREEQGSAVGASVN